MDSLDSGKINFWEKFSGNKAYHRAPFYPVFLSLLYKLVGISPLIIKYIQLLLIIISGLLLIPIARLAFGEKSFKVGLISFIAFVLLNYKFSEHLMPENWQFLFLALTIICLFYHHDGSKTHSILLGIILGISVLNKGTTFFFFPIIIVFDLFFGRLRNGKYMVNLIIFACSFILVTGVWSLWLSLERHRFTFVSAQPADVLLDGNNEFCSDGLWHPEWRNKPGSFYNIDQKGDQPEIIRVVNFYIKNPVNLGNFPAKIKAGFLPVYSFLALIFVCGILITLHIIKKITQKSSSEQIPKLFSFSIPVPFVLCFLNFLLFTLVFYSNDETYPSRYVKTMDGIFILMCVYLFLKTINIIFPKALIHGIRETKTEKQN